MSEGSTDRRRAHLKEVTSDSAPDSLGAELRAARARMGEDLKSIAKVIKIKPEYLEALEDGDIEALPGRPYAIGFTRTYAEFLGLDAAACVARLKEEHFSAPAPAATEQIGLPEIKDEVRIPKGTLFAVGVLLFCAIYGGVYLFRSANEYMEQRSQGSSATAGAQLGAGEQSLPPPPAQPTSQDSSVLPPIGVEPAAAPTTPPGPANAAGAPGSAGTVQAPPKAAPDTAHQAAAGTAGTQTAQQAPDDRYQRAIAEAPKTFGVASKQNRVALRASEDVFVRVESDGERDQVLFEGTLGKGDLYFVPSMPNLMLVTRNGGAVDLFVDGLDKGAAGPAGIALKGLPLDADSLKNRP